jgi:hypothetical protein
LPFLKLDTGLAVFERRCLDIEVHLQAGNIDPLTLLKGVDIKTEAVLQQLEAGKVTQQDHLQQLYLVATDHIQGQADEIQRLQKHIEQLEQQLETGASGAAVNHVCAGFSDSYGPANIPVARQITANSPAPPTHRGKRLSLVLLQRYM